MKRTAIGALLLTAALGSQVLNAATPTATDKVGLLTFSLTDTWQQNITFNGTPAKATIGPLAACKGTAKYVTKSGAINNKTIIAAIGDTLNISFSTSAKLAIVGYENIFQYPPYPIILVAGDAGDDGVVPYLSATFNGPRDVETAEIIVAMTGPGALDGNKVATPWPNNALTDWVDYDKTEGHADVLPAGYWPKAKVFIKDTGRCIGVSPFFAFEESFCYFCWDTADRVTSGSLTTGASTSGDICIGTLTTCGIKGSGTTQFYLTIKFNNDVNDNVFLNAYTTELTPLLPVAVNLDEIYRFSVGGVVKYPWSIKSLGPMGTFTMAQANGFAGTPYCGVVTGSVKITETDNVKVPICADDY